MTKNQIKNKVEDLKFWIDANPNHQDRSTVIQKLKEITIKKNKDAFRGN